MKKIILVISCIAIFSCASHAPNEAEIAQVSNKVGDSRDPAQVANFGTFKTFKGTPLYNSCHITLVDLNKQQAIHEAHISTFESVGAVPVLDRDDKVVGAAKTGKHWGTSSTCFSSRTASKNVFRETKTTALDYCFKMNDADSEDINSAYAEIALVRLFLQKGSPLSASQMVYLNQDNTLKINGQGEGSVVVEGKYRLSAKCALSNN